MPTLREAADMRLACAVVAVVVAGSAAAAPRRCLSGCPAYLVLKDGCCPDPPVTRDTPGTLSMRSQASGASGRLGDEPWAPLPLLLGRLLPGVYRYQARAPGVEPVSGEVLVRPGEHVTLEVALCAPGMSAFPGGLCCWPGQTPSGNQCTGAPRCPTGFAPVRGSSCAPEPCASGQTRVSGVCCWPGQRVDPQLGLCVGEPSGCPPPLLQQFGTCLAPASQRDEDHDGLMTDVDQCFDQPEDKDGVQDDDGCPDLDDDADGVPDVSDRCPMVPEDRDGWQDQDGCPDPDNDGDGFLDAQDKCPAAAEDKDGFEDDDGCPDLDDDGDGVPDVSDKCPSQQETMNGWQDGDGCRDTVPPIVEVETKTDPVRVRFGLLGVTTSQATGFRGPTRGTGGGGLGLASAVTLHTWFGVEGGFMGQWPLGGGAPSTLTFFAGAAPVRVGLWKERYGGDAWLIAEPYVHVLFDPSSGFPGFQFGNRFSLRSDSTWSVSLAYETGRAGFDGGFRVMAEVQPDPNDESTFLYGSFALFGEGGLFMGGAPQGFQVAGVFRAIVNWRGLGAGLGVFTPGVNASGYLAPTFEIAPVRLWSDGAPLRKRPYLEPVLQFAFTPYGPATSLGFRFNTEIIHVGMYLQLPSGLLSFGYLGMIGVSWGGPK